MKIVELVAENVKRLSAVSIKPDGSTVVIGGDNAAGKSSVLDSISYALGGEKLLPPRPLRNGAKNGRIKLDLDELVVTRTFKRAADDSISTKLEIKSKEGFDAPSPQTLLASLYGKMAFDPLEFSRLKPKDQLESLKELVGLDFTEQDKQREKWFAARTDCNRALKAKKAELAACGICQDAPEAEVSVADLITELKRREKINDANQAKRDALEEAERHTEALGDRLLEAREAVKEAEQALARAQQSLQHRLSGLKECQQAQAKIAEDVAGLEDSDCEEIQNKISQADTLNRAFRQNQQHLKLSDAVAQIDNDSQALTDRIGDIDAAKAEAMKAAAFPVDGLGFDATGITFNGLPFEQASSAEQLRVSVAMGLALNPKLRVMLIRDGSLLGDKALAMVAEMAAKADAQIWIERVSKGKECSVIIEDGHVAEVAEELEGATI